jgi:hypothetical protein
VAQRYDVRSAAIIEILAYFGDSFQSVIAAVSFYEVAETAVIVHYAFISAKERVHCCVRKESVKALVVALVKIVFEFSRSYPIVYIVVGALNDPFDFLDELCSAAEA